MPSRNLAATFAVLASLPALAAPVAAQPGRDLLAPQPRTAIRTERLNLSEFADSVRVAAHRREAPSIGGDATRVRQAATEVYSYDDDDFEFYRFVDDVTGDIHYEVEAAQRFRLREPGTVEYAIACMGRGQDDTDSDARFVLSFYAGGSAAPATVLGVYDVPARLEEAGTYLCFEIEGELEGLELPAGEVWVSVSWRRGTPPENTKLLGIDEDNSGGMQTLRFRREAGEDWGAWQADPDEGVYGIRVAVNHPDPEPDPDPDPEPDPEPDPDPDPGPPTGPGWTDCVPETTPLLFDGGYRVQMCYETPAGDIGEGKAGIWASGESGLLWFFNRGNAEVLIKVLSSACGLANNEHVWVFVAPVTDLAFNLHVTDSEGQRTWSHRNRQGDTASTRSDTRAFPCN